MAVASMDAHAITNNFELTIPESTMYVDYYLDQLPDLHMGNVGNQTWSDVYEKNDRAIKQYNADIGLGRKQGKPSGHIGHYSRKFSRELCEILRHVGLAGSDTVWNGRKYFPGLKSFNADGTVNVYISEEDFVRNIAKPMKMGKYLRRLNRYTDDMVNQYANEFKSFIMLMKYVKLEIARTEEDIVYVYENGPSSCMGHEAHEFESHVHPCTVYATPDIGVGYVRVGERIVARAVLNMVDDKFSVIYGNAALLEPLLEEAGYEDGNIDGCRIQRIKEDGDTYVMPFIDDANYVATCDDPNYFIVEGGDGTEYACTETNGLNDECSVCPCCGNHFNREYDGVWVEAASEMYCNGSCAEEEGYVHISDSYGDWHHRDDAYYCRTNGEYYLDTDDLVPFDGEWYRYDDDRVVYSEDQDETLWRDDAVWIDAIHDWVDADREDEFEEEDECEIA